MMSEFFLHMLQSQNKQGFSRTYCVQIVVLSVHELHEPHKSQLLLWSRAAGAIQTWQICSSPGSVQWGNAASAGPAEKVSCWSYNKLN